MTIAFHLYSSEGCHLCEQAKQLCDSIGLTNKLKIVDIVDDEALVTQYGVHIPVLERLVDHEKLFWPFTIEQVERLLQ